MKHNVFKIIVFILMSLASSISVAKPVKIKILFVGDPSNNAFKGVNQGIDEANLQGQFLGQAYELIQRSMNNIHDIQPKNIIAILVASHKKNLDNIVESFPKHPVFNLTLDNDTLRLECRENLLNIIPSSAMKQDALAQWQQKRPESKAVAQAWHEKFVKYAAGDLNKRLKKAYGITMDDTVWAGWASVKMIADTVVRDRIQHSQELLNYLKNHLAFDGQKGINMSFRITGQLRQPLLLIDNDEIVAEAPVRGVVDTTDLDSLGITECAK